MQPQTDDDHDHHDKESTHREGGDLDHMAEVLKEDGEGSNAGGLRHSEVDVGKEVVRIGVGLAPARTIEKRLEDGELYSECVGAVVPSRAILSVSWERTVVIVYVHQAVIDYLCVLLLVH